MKPLIDNLQLPKRKPCCGKLSTRNSQPSTNMKRQHTIQIIKAENGFSINSMSDDASKNRKLIAKDETEVKSLVTDIVNNDLFPAPVAAVVPAASS